MGHPGDGFGGRLRRPPKPSAHGSLGSTSRVAPREQMLRGSAPGDEYASYTPDLTRALLCAINIVSRVRPPGSSAVRPGGRLCGRSKSRPDLLRLIASDLSGLTASAFTGLPQAGPGRKPGQGRQRRKGNSCAVRGSGPKSGLASRQPIRYPTGPRSCSAAGKGPAFRLLCFSSMGTIRLPATLCAVRPAEGGGAGTA